jgi:hypothetical protein
MLQAVEDALASVGTTDAAEAERFVVMFEALLPFIQPSTSEPGATLLVEFQ